MVIERAAADSGPLIHLHEIGWLEALRIVRTLAITEAIHMECGRRIGPEYRDDVPIPVDTTELDEKGGRILETLRDEVTLSEADASIMALTLQEGLPLLFTDDLAVRRLAHALDIRPVGSVGILARANRENLMTLAEAEVALDALVQDSTLFITESLIEYAKGQLREKV